MQAISLGWGVQSFTLAAMSALGELPRVDVAIHGDTTHERTETYRFVERWTPWLAEHGVKVVIVTDAHIQLVKKSGMVAIPAHTLSEKGGQLTRHCTYDWKLRPMRQWLQANRKREPVELWIGISLDEVERAKPADVKYITHRWPFLEKRMTRQDCVNWLIRHGLEVPPKSACVFCPFHSRGAWRDLKAHGNGDWSKAVEIDEQLRYARPPYELYLHSSKKPLREIGDGIDAQPELDLTGEECSGVCFV